MFSGWRRSLAREAMAEWGWGVDRTDVLVLVGLALLGAGLWLYWPPLALMVIGGLLLAIGLAGAVWRSR